MTDIQKMIEEEINNRFNQDLFKAFSDIETSIAKTEFRNGALFALSQLQHANRWRKVSEELPEDCNKVWGIFLYDLGRYSGRTKGQVYYFNEKWWHEPIGSCKIEVEVTEWKTIE